MLRHPDGHFIANVATLVDNGLYMRVGNVQSASQLRDGDAVRFHKFFPEDYSGMRSPGGHNHSPSESNHRCFPAC
jgi:hypothetical protein